MLEGDYSDGGGPFLYVCQLAEGAATALKAEGAATAPLATEGAATAAGLAPCEYKYYNDLKTFDDAEATCQGLGLQLAILLDPEDNRRALASVPANASVVSWIGSHDQDVEGKWTWLPNNIPATWTNWDEGEPNSWNGDTLEDCTVMKNFNGKWNDIRCSNEFAYICENANSCPKYAAPPPAPDSKAPSGANSICQPAMIPNSNRNSSNMCMDTSSPLSIGSVPAPSGFECDFTCNDGYFPVGRMVCQWHDSDFVGEKNNSNPEQFYKRPLDGLNYEFYGGR